MPSNPTRPLRWALLAGSTLVALLCAEWVVRLFHPLVPPSPPLYEFDSELGWREKPGIAIVLRNSEGVDIPIRINRESFRGPDRPIERSPGTQRILVLGDSFTEALAVREEKSYPFLLEEALNARHEGVFQVFGLGVSSYGTVHELLRLRRVIDRYAPDLVVFQVCVNDFWDNLASLSYQKRGPWAELSSSGESPVHFLPVSSANDSQVPAPMPRWRRPFSWLKWHSALVQTALGLFDSNRIEARHAVGPAHGPPRDVTIPMRDPRFESSRRVTAQLLRLARDEAASREIAFLAYFNPSTFAFSPAVAYNAHGRTERFLLDREVERWLIEPVLDFCRSEAISCVWSRDLFADAVAHGRSVNFTNDPHWNELGHRLVATDLLPRILEALPHKAAGGAGSSASGESRVPAHTPK